MDGSVSGGGASDRKPAPALGGDPEQMLATVLDRDPPHINEAFGPGQFDRIMQLAETIERFESNEDCRFHAVGIVGSDIYDKMAVVQALRPHFSDKVFFTTDMDARLIPTPAMPLTRNLVVISAFGDELHHDIQRDSPPFRDGYQASIYLATLLAVEDPVFRGEQAGKHLRDSELKKLLSDSRVFEIGRTKAIGLDAAERDGERSLHPSPALHTPGKRTIILWVLFLALAWASLDMWIRMMKKRRVDEEKKRQQERKDEKLESIPTMFFKVGYLLAFGALLAIGYGVVGFEAYREGEPSYLAQGVSMWPTEVIRTIAILLGLVLMRSTIDRVHRSDRELKERVFPAVSVPLANKRLKWPIGGLAWFRERKRVAVGSDKVWENADSPGGVWAVYRSLGLISHRVARIAPFVVLFTSIACVVFFLQPTAKVPFRGEWAAWTDRGIAILLTAVTITLSMIIIDSARLSTRFIGKLRAAGGGWPDSPARRDLCTRHHLDSKEVAEHLFIEAACHRAATVGHVIWYPLIVMAVILFGQYSTFDAWGWPIPFVISMMMVGSVVFVNGVLLLRQTEAARNRALADMHQRLDRMRSSKDQGERDSADRHERLLESAKAVTAGTFGGLRSPMLDAVLLPSGGLAAMTLLEIAVIAMSS